MTRLPHESASEDNEPESSYRDGLAGSDHGMSDVAMPDEGYQTGAAVNEKTAEQEDADSEDETSMHSAQRGHAYRSPSAGLEKLGKDMIKMQQSIRRLRELGVEDLVETLPRIVAVGDQSHGKSSLIEAISEIKVPRNEGACTRCPMEINLAGTSRPDAVWNCTISLRQSFTYNPPTKSPRASSKRGGYAGLDHKGRPFGHFVPQDLKDTFFAFTRDKNEVEHLIERAQHATLSPSVDPEIFKPENRGLVPQEFDVKFSPNVVRLEITGPNLPMLTFYDLPGVINRLDKAEDNHLITTVENLVKDYIKSENSLILLTQSMTEDPSNSRAGKIVSDMGAENRCIGVLTKPDRCPSSNFQQWESMLMGESFRMGHGYFVTRQPSQEALKNGISHQQARAEERAFFEAGPWASSLVGFKDQFGTAKLQEALSQKLSHQIQLSLPDINDQVQIKLNSIRTELQQFPDPPGNDLLLRVVRQLELFRQQIQESVDGGYPNNAFQKGWNELATHFRNAMLNSRPALLLNDMGSLPRRSRVDRERTGSSTVESPSERKGEKREAIELISSDDDSPSRPKRQRQAAKKAAPVGTPQSVSRRLKLTEEPPFASAARNSPRFTLTKIREVIRDGHINGIPNQVDPRTITYLCSTSVKHWRQPMIEFIKTSCSMMNDMITHHLGDAFGTWKETQLFVSAQEAIATLIDEFLHGQINAAERGFRLEEAQPMTLNSESLEVSKQEAFKLIQEKRLDHIAEIQVSTIEARLGRQFEDHERKIRKAKITWGSENVGPDLWLREVDVIATVRAYYVTAANRFVDHLCQSVQVELFRGSRNELCSKLEIAFGLNESDPQQRCAFLTAENPERELMRKRLQRDEAHLTEARDELEKVMRELS
ncbi:MAG: hypothetical protein M4579_000421 [Chaenotheca gracillima]|nr:MAG: hypothetical protein M4579_000421 [Chaenotheca gracillima]